MTPPEPTLPPSTPASTARLSLGTALAGLALLLALAACGGGGGGGSAGSGSPEPAAAPAPGAVRASLGDAVGGVEAAASAAAGNDPVDPVTSPQVQVAAATSASPAAPAAATPSAAATHTRPPAGAGVASGGLAAVPGTALTPDMMRMLEAWRRSDRSGMACAHCHAADAMDLALFDFPLADIRRRASFHVEPPDVEQIVALVRHMRAVHRITPKDRVTTRPLQPGGRVLPGATPQQRDHAFALHLVGKLPTLNGPRIARVEDALRARDELLAYDLRREPLGVALPRWSEDGFHGSGRGTMNDWLPEVPPIPVDAAAAARLFALHDAYIVSPTPQNLWAIQAHLDTAARPGAFAGFAPPGAAAGRFGHLKQASLLVGQHLLRMEHAGVPIATPIGRPVVVAPDYRPVNAVFGVGSVANQNQPVMAEFAAPIVSALTDGRNASATAFRAMFTQEVLVPWWVLGFVLEPGQQSVANWGEYFPQSLVGHRGSRAPLLTHHAFVTTTMQLHRTYTPVLGRDGWRTRPSLLAFWHSGALPGFTHTRDGGAWANAEHQRLYEHFAANTTRMQLLLVRHEADTACAAGTPFSASTNVAELDQRIESWQAAVAAVHAPTAAADRALADETYRALERLRRGCGPAPADGSGSGLTVTATVDGQSQALAHATRRLEVPVPAGVGSTNFGVVAEGRIEARFDDRCTFRAAHGPNAHGPIQLWVNGQLAFEHLPGSAARSVPVPLRAGERVALRLVYERNRGVGQPTRVHWESPRQLPQVVPSTQLHAR